MDQVHKARSVPAPPRRAEQAVPRARFRPDVEGVRAIAILLVVAYHAGIRPFSGGYVGVDVFFVLSGYLITWLLVAEAQERGTIHLGRFYARRARRLLPALAVVLLFTIVAGAMIYAPMEHGEIANTSIATAAYASNLYFAHHAADYFGSALRTNPLLHTWSLSVEEQFYLVWPMFVMFAFGVLRWQRGAPSRRRLLVWMALLAAPSLVLCVILTYVRQPWAFFSSPARAWEFAVGAVAVLVPATPRAGRPPSRWRAVRVAREAMGAGTWAVHLPGWFGLGAILLAAVLFRNATPFPGAAVLLPVAGTVLLLRVEAVAGTSWLGTLLASRPMQLIGRLSYSWYLWHWPVFVLAIAAYGWPGTYGMVGLALLSLLLAAASYHLVENPIRHHRLLAGHPGRSLAMAAAVAVLSITTALAWRAAAAAWQRSPKLIAYTRAGRDDPEIYAMGCGASLYSATLVECTTGPDGASHVAVLVGDSHAAQWYGMVHAIAARDGWKVITMIKADCPAVNASYFADRIGRMFTECDAWRAAALRRIAQLSPELVIVGTYTSRYPFTADEWEAGTTSVVDALSRAGRHLILVRDPPHPSFDVPVCLAESVWRARFLPRRPCTFRNINDSTSREAMAYRAQRDAVGHVSNATILDMTRHICHRSSCDVVSDGVVVFRDVNHLTQAFVARLGDEFSRYVAAIERGDGTPEARAGASTGR